MSDNEIRHTSSTGGQKAGNDERHDLIPVMPLRKLAQHFGIGAKKYDDNNWRKGYDIKLSFAAMMRHAWQFWGGEDIDAETGSPHLTAVAWHAFTMLENLETHPEFDTRLKTIEQRGVRTETNDSVAYCDGQTVDTRAQEKLVMVGLYLKKFALGSTWGRDIADIINGHMVIG